MLNFKAPPPRRFAAYPSPSERGVNGLGYWKPHPRAAKAACPSPSERGVISKGYKNFEC